MPIHQARDHQRMVHNHNILISLSIGRLREVIGFRKIVSPLQKDTPVALVSPHRILCDLPVQIQQLSKVLYPYTQIPQIEYTIHNFKKDEVVEPIYIVESPTMYHTTETHVRRVLQNHLWTIFPYDKTTEYSLSNIETITILKTPLLHLICEQYTQLQLQKLKEYLEEKEDKDLKLNHIPEIISRIPFSLRPEHLTQLSEFISLKINKFKESTLKKTFLQRFVQTYVTTGVSLTELGKAFKQTASTLNNKEWSDLIEEMFPTPVETPDALSRVLEQTTTAKEGILKLKEFLPLAKDAVSMKKGIDVYITKYPKDSLSFLSDILSEVKTWSKNDALNFLLQIYEKFIEQGIEKKTLMDSFNTLQLSLINNDPLKAVLLSLTEQIKKKEEESKSEEMME